MGNVIKTIKVGRSHKKHRVDKKEQGDEVGMVDRKSVKVRPGDGDPRPSVSRDSGR